MNKNRYIKSGGLNVPPEYLFEENSVIQLYTASVLQLFASKDMQEYLSKWTYKTEFLNYQRVATLGYIIPSYKYNL